VARRRLLFKEGGGKLVYIDNHLGTTNSLPKHRHKRIYTEESTSVISEAHMGKSHAEITL
jgi:hypothetical protein